jgi:8-oxo-dGTP diphosphatase
VKGGNVLLIRKKRGLGAGKINAPGGKLEPRETALDAAIRETQEEIGVTPLSLEKRGVLHFQFTNGYSLHCVVFVASDLDGEPVETDEATPFWFGVDDVPYDEMWEDDRHWLPPVLKGTVRYFEAWFEFDDDRMVTKEVRVSDPPMEVGA